MFVKPNADLDLIFIKSRYVNVFPCGRRRSELVDYDNNPDTVSDRYYIPFDPEARLNTEANNRKHSGLNGFKQSFLLHDWDTTDGAISLVLKGYLFNIITKDLAAQAKFSYSSANDFGDALINVFKNAAKYDQNKFNEANEAKELYVNIKLADISFFSGSGLSDIGTLATEILRDHSDLNSEPAACLDMLIAGSDKQKSDSYYFSGLSFSYLERGGTSDNDILSYKILVKDSGTWKINEQFRLPKIDHGETEDSIIIYGDLDVGTSEKGADLDVHGTITGETIQINKDGNMLSVPAVTVVQQSSGAYQLQFTGAAIVPPLS